MPAAVMHVLQVLEVKANEFCTPAAEPPTLYNPPPPPPRRASRYNPLFPYKGAGLVDFRRLS